MNIEPKEVTIQLMVYTEIISVHCKVLKETRKTCFVDKIQGFLLFTLAVYMVTTDI